MVCLTCCVQAWLRGHGLAVTGNKPELTERIEEALRSQQDLLLKQAGAKKAKVQQFEFEKVATFVVGDRVIYVAKELNGELGTTDDFGVHVVTVAKVENGKGKGEAVDGDEEGCVIVFEAIHKGKKRTFEASSNHFYKLPLKPSFPSYEKYHLVLFQRTTDGREDMVESLLEVGWLAAPFKFSAREAVKVDSFDGLDVLLPEYVLFDVFEAKLHNNDVEFKAVLFEIEFSDNKTNIEASESE